MSHSEGKVFLIAILLLSAPPDCAARRLEAENQAESSDLVETETSYGQCTLEGNEPCSQIKELIMKEQKDYKCMPFSPGTLSCDAGSVADPTVYEKWDVQRSCFEAWHTHRRTCHLQNRWLLYENSHVKLYSGDKSDCLEPVLGPKDCESLKPLIVETEKSQSALDPSLTLADALRALIYKAPAEWYYLPSHKVAIKLLARTLAEHVKDESSRSGNTLGPIWQALLRYCDVTEARALARGKSAEEGLGDCLETTGLGELAVLHPAWVAAEQGFESVVTLADVERLGLVYLDEALWMRLASLAQGQGPSSYRALVSKVGALITTAGQRNELELDLGLQFQYLSIAEGATPEGGERRLSEMRAARSLRNALDSENKIVIQQAIDNAEFYINAGAIQWVDEQELKSSLASVKAKLKGMLEHKSKTPKGTFFCDDVSLPADCTDKEIMVAVYVASPMECSGAADPKDCYRQYIKHIIDVGVAAQTTY